MMQLCISLSPFIRGSLSVGLISPDFDHLKIRHFSQVGCLLESVEQDQHLQRAIQPILR